MQSNLAASFDALNVDLVACRKCPRLVAWREKVGAERVARFRDQAYWAKPAPNFGDPEARHLIVGLAPAAHGANRTGRMFTGDRSGDFLFAALYRAGLANQPDSAHAEDGLSLTEVMITAAVHCAPPDNKPAPDEIATCQPYLDLLIASREWASVLCLGGLAWKTAFDAFKRLDRAVGPRPQFSHASSSILSCGTRLVGCYHPSQQNTFTGRLTPEMMDAALRMFLST
jgi:uracil-DNA glycosylase family 4